MIASVNSAVYVNRFNPQKTQVQNVSFGGVGSPIKSVAKNPTFWGAIAIAACVGGAFLWRSCKNAIFELDMPKFTQCVANEIKSNTPYADRVNLIEDCQKSATHFKFKNYFRR